MPSVYNLTYEERVDLLPALKRSAMKGWGVVITEFAEGQVRQLSVAEQ